MNHISFRDAAVEILRVTPEGEFIWHDDADRLIASEQRLSVKSILLALRKHYPPQEPQAAHQEALNEFAEDSVWDGEEP